MSTEKLQALAHYIIAECGRAPERLGAIRLNKAIWFSDIIMYQLTGRSITEETYVKRQHGPVPRQILHALQELQRGGAILIREPEAAYDVRRYFSLRNPSSDILADAEKTVARDVLAAILGYTANAISEATHDVIWSAARDGQEIPLEATLVAIPGEVTPEVLEWANGVAANANSAVTA